MAQTRKIKQPWEDVVQHFFTLWLALIVIVVGVAGYYVLRAPYREWRALARSQRLETQLVKYQAQFVTVQQEVSAWRTLAAQRGNQLDLMLPSTDDLPNLLAQLEAVTSTAGFRLAAVSIGEAAATTRAVSKVAAPAGVRPLPLSISVTGGSYAKLKELLAAYHRSWRVLTVDSFGVGGDSSYRLQMTAFYYAR